MITKQELPLPKNIGIIEFHFNDLKVICTPPVEVNKSPNEKTGK